jgi:hypothetical protein
MKSALKTFSRKYVSLIKRNGETKTSDIEENRDLYKALGYGLNDRGSRVRFPAGDGNFSLHHRCVQNGSGAHPASYPMGTRGLFPLGIKRPGREADHSTPSSVEVKNAWSYTSTPPKRLHGVVLS